jgi:hypothetical protein
MDGESANRLRKKRILDLRGGGSGLIGHVKLSDNSTYRSEEFMLRKILAVDHAYARRIAVDNGHPHFPAAIREVVQGDDGVDLLNRSARTSNI